MHSLRPDLLARLTSWGVLLRAYGEFEERVGRVAGGRGSKSQQVRDAVERRVAPFRISELERDCPAVSRDTIRLVLRQMRDEGRVTLEGRGPGARWRRAEMAADLKTAEGLLLALEEAPPPETADVDRLDEAQRLDTLPNDRWSTD